MSMFAPSATLGNITFGTMSNDGAYTYSPKMTIRASGNVGIGTTSPVNKFEIANTLASPATTGSATNGFQRLVDSA